jgi:ComF family protein
LSYFNSYQMVTKVFKLMKKLIDWLAPKTCIVCTLMAEQAICGSCLEELPWLQHVCEICAQSLDMIHDFPICGQCLTNPPPVTRNITLFQYRFPVTSLITQLKFHQNLLYANALGGLLATRIQHCYQEAQEPLPDFILPVPLHRKRLFARGYNQALEIARPIQRQLHLPLEYRLIKRIKPTLPQTLIEAAKRKDNVKNAFALTTRIIGKHVAIVDDVITTFSTVLELARLLQNNGVERVDVWCIARAGG